MVSRTKSVCLIVQNHYDIDPRVRRKAELLRNNGYRVDVIALRRPDGTEDRYSLNGVDVHCVPLEKKRGSFLRYIFEYAAFFVMASLKVAGLMRKRRYRVIDVNTLPDFLVFAGLLPRLMGARVILDMHEIMPEFFMSKYGVREDHRLIRLIRLQEKASMYFADHVLTINEPILDLLRARGLAGDKATVFMNSADSALFSGPAAGSGGPANGGFVFMYHGTLTRIYGLDIALRAFAGAAGDMPSAEFWIVGDGPEREDLGRIAAALGISDSVRFFGAIPQQEIPGYLGRCHAGVLATRRDAFLDLSFSNKLPEYIATGKPVIASRLRAIARYFTGDALAYFEPEDERALAERMKDLYSHPKQRETLIREARREYAAIDWDVMKKRYLEVVNRLAGNPRTDAGPFRG